MKMILKMCPAGSRGVDVLSGSVGAQFSGHHANA